MRTGGNDLVQVGAGRHVNAGAVAIGAVPGIQIRGPIHGRRRLRRRRFFDGQESQGANAGNDQQRGNTCVRPVNEMALRAFVNKRQEDQEQNEQAGKHHGPDDFQVAGKIFQHLEEKEKVPLGAWGVICVGWIGPGFDRRADKIGQRDQDNKHDQYRNRIFEDDVGEKWNAPGFGFFITLCVGFFFLFVHGSLFLCRHSRDTNANYQIEMDKHQRCQGGRQYPDVRAEKARQRDCG